MQKKYPGTPTGLIPACAGKTPNRPTRPRRDKAHPRVCGENGLTQAPLADGVGSSPRVRGKRTHVVRLEEFAGLIPACAGKTAGIPYSTWLSEPHPRVCGENIDALTKGMMEKGSSPRVRGKPNPRGA